MTNDGTIQRNIKKIMQQVVVDWKATTIIGEATTIKLIRSLKFRKC
jgi:hypothetical protein